MNILQQQHLSLVQIQRDVVILVKSSNPVPFLSPHLYLSPSSLVPSGSKLFLIPSSVLLTASLAPIIGLSTAIGTALTTALSGP